jgi:transcriptional regulator with XRE-family HTH domain
MGSNNNEALAALGGYTREQRNRLGLTQTQLAERLGWAQERISTIENGKYGMPSLPALARLAGALEIPVNTFLAATGLVGETSSREDVDHDP